MNTNVNTERFLPIGTVVMLNGGEKRVMITGFCTVTADDNSTMYDYCGCLYPEGVVSSDKNLLFNHSQIAKIFALGYSDDEEKQFKAKLKEVLANK